MNDNKNHMLVFILLLFSCYLNLQSLWASQQMEELDEESDLYVTINSVSPSTYGDQICSSCHEEYLLELNGELPPAEPSPLKKAQLAAVDDFAIATVYLTYKQTLPNSADLTNLDARSLCFYSAKCLELIYINKTISKSVKTKKLHSRLTAKLACYKKMATERFKLTNSAFLQQVLILAAKYNLINCVKITLQNTDTHNIFNKNFGQFFSTFFATCIRFDSYAVMNYVLDLIKSYPAIMNVQDRSGLTVLDLCAFECNFNPMSEENHTPIMYKLSFEIFMCKLQKLGAKFNIISNHPMFSDFKAKLASMGIHVN